MIDPTDLRDVFDRAASLPPQQRAAFLAHACDGNDGLRREVERLLAADARLGSAFDTEPGSDPATGAVAAGGMSLQPGTRLGPYEIVAALGAGGMGEVYKARDTRLDRTVAIKVLSHELTADPAARQRFDREARAIVALSHPHICALHDVGHQDDVDFLVMEFLDGETLAARLRRGKLPLDDALTCATHVADALAAAHRAGIVHRDLKPGNIMLTASGVKLLDFGLAKRRQPPVASDITKLAAEPLTHTGMILGTVQYMAPEQLEGRSADERTDIFAFGVVLYEMLTGRQAFEGASSAALIGNILHSDPPKPSSVERLTPASIDVLVRGCLAKEPVKRWQSIDDVQRRLMATRDLVRPATQGGRYLATVSAVAAILLIVAAGVVSWWRWPQPFSTDPQRSRSPVQRNLTRLTFEQGLQTDPTFSPDGRFIAYASDKGGNLDIWVKPVGGGDAVQVTRSPAQDSEPAWSPDGSAIAFRSDRDGSGVFLVSSLGGTERRLTNFGRYPLWSPDASEILFLDGNLDFGGVSAIYTVSLHGEPPKQLLSEFTRSGSWGWIALRSDGRISFHGEHRTQGHGFFTVARDGSFKKSKQLAGAELLPPPINAANDRGRFHWNGSGTAIYVESVAGNVRNLWKVTVEPDSFAWTSVERLTTGVGGDVAARLSSDGTRVVFATRNESERLWSFPLNNQLRIGTGHPISEEGAFAGQSTLSSDGTVVAFNLGRLGGSINSLWLANLDTGKSELVSPDAGTPVWSRDGRQLAYQRWRAETANGDRRFATALVVRSLAGPRTTDQSLGFENEPSRERLDTGRACAPDLHRGRKRGASRIVALVGWSRAIPDRPFRS